MSGLLTDLEIKVTDPVGKKIVWMQGRWDLGADTENKPIGTSVVL
jgi:hypothetical protein